VSGATSAGALVVDVHLRSSVAGLRGLGRAGVPAVALGVRRSAAGRWSRYAAARALAPDPALDLHGYATAIAELVERDGPLVAYPGSEEGVDGVVAASELSSSVVAPFPVESLTNLRHKPTLARLGAAIGVETPTTVLEVPASALRSNPPSFPCVIKPVVQDGPVRSTTIVTSLAELKAVLARLRDESPVLVQPVVPGELVSLGIVLDRDGAVVAAFQQVAKRTWPAAAGSTAMGLSVPLDPELLERAAEVLRGAGYWGLADMEFLMERERFTLIDVNTRYYGNLALAECCGVNLPAAWRAAALGRPAPSRLPSYRAGVTYRWLEADLMSALRGHPGRLMQLAPRSRVGAMWAADDPLPGALMAVSMVTDRIRCCVAARR